MYAICAEGRSRSIIVSVIQRQSRVCAMYKAKTPGGRVEEHDNIISCSGWSTARTVAYVVYNSKERTSFSLDSAFVGLRRMDSVIL